MVGLIGTCRDVTDERVREEALRIDVDLFYDEIALSVWDIGDPDDPASPRLLACNPAAERASARGDALARLNPLSLTGCLSA